MEILDALFRHATEGIIVVNRGGVIVMANPSLSPFQTSEGQFVVAFIIDITQRKTQEKRILEANEQIHMLNAELEERVRQRTAELADAIRSVEKSQREVVNALEKEIELNQMKSQFVTVASHEFRTPLATILSSSSLISKYSSAEDDEKRQKHSQRIKSTVNNLTEILNDFLSIGKLDVRVEENMLLKGC
ncbi:histidine kinase dimerization/phospho-acceptor domain-containing protein [Dyadobacter endophyticus]|uniref:histidine kinase dimerization/phospho-acceptor domain-containing protein n=1 Tax=Dyadobacter endophyticus TaxID=1749036 RepID=UPI003CEC8EDC